MERIHPLKNLLQFHLASDSSTVFHLPLISSSLTPEAFSPSSHLSKWTTRVNSLIHAKDPGARWAGICLALQTASLSKNMMLECAQGWITIVLPMLSRTEPLPIWKAAIRLISFIFTTSVGLSEFQRQVVTPNIPKFSLALVTLAQKQSDMELTILAMDALSILVPLHPNLHRALHPSISGLTLQLLDGSPAAPTPSTLVNSAARLNATLHAIGGKVGSVNLWRKSVDETVAFCWVSFAALRTTYHHKGQHAIASRSAEDPLVVIPWNLDRLRCGVALLRALLRSTTSRPVPVPIAAIIELCFGLLRCTPDEEEQDHTDRSVRATEESVIPWILHFACDLTGCLVQCVRQRFTPHFSKLLSLMTFHLEQDRPISQRLPFIRLLPVLISSCYPPHNPLLHGRLVKAILPVLSVFLTKESDARKDRSQADGKDAGTGRKGKKRARAYEGDELFKVGKEVICSTAQEGDIILATLEALPYLLRTPNLAQYLQSITSRVLLSLLLSIPQMSASSISTNLGLRDRILQRIKTISLELAAGTSMAMSNSLALVVEPAMDGASSPFFQLEANQNQRFIDVLLHPRLPPLLRSIPPLDTIVLARADESTEEKNAREALGLASMAVDITRVTPEFADAVTPSASSPSTTRIEEQTTTTISRTSAILGLQPQISHVTTASASIFSPFPHLGPDSDLSQLAHDRSQAGGAFPASQLAELGHSLLPEPSLNHPSGSVGEQPSAIGSDIPRPPTSMLIDDDDDDEEMPTINMESDSDVE